MIKLITFLGVLNDRATAVRYRHHDQVYEGLVFAEALQVFCPHDMMLLCVTQSARETTLPLLRQRTHVLDDPRVRVVDIPTGEDSDQIWATFKTIVDNVNEDDHVKFDITHGLRSISFMVFLFAAYLKSAKNVSIDAIYYGALDLRSSNKEGVAPVIDLSEFSAMLDWIMATNQFVRNGDGSDLASLIRTGEPVSSPLINDPANHMLRDQMESMAGVIEQMSWALALARPIETMERASALRMRLKLAGTAVAERAQPFAVLMDKVRTAYAPFALLNPLAPANLKTDLRLQLDMFKWYVDKRAFVQAAALGRELVVSLVAFGLGENNIDDLFNVRQPVENALNNYRGIRDEKETPYTVDDMRKVDVTGQLATLWSDLIDIRNDLAHVGMSTKRDSAASLIDRLKNLYPRIEAYTFDILSAELP